MRSLLITSILLFGMSSWVFSQISEAQLRPVDSAYVSSYLQFGNFHTVNSHPTIGGPNLITWDHGSGLYQNIPGYYVGWSNTNRVDETTANLFNAVPGQSYKTFNINAMQDVQSYEDSLLAWFSSIGIPVGMRKHNDLKYSLKPNPVETHAVLQLKTENGLAYTVSVYDVSGRLLYTTNGKSGSHGIHHKLDFSAYQTGLYFVTLTSNKFTLHTRVLKK